MKRLRLVLIILQLLSLSATAAVGPEMFEPVMTIPLGGARSFAIAPDYVVALGDRQVTRLPLSTQPRLEADAVIALTSEFDGITVDGDRAYVYSRQRRLAVLDWREPAVTAPVEYLLADTIHAATARHDTLFAALGVAGIALYDASLPGRPREIARLTAGAYYTGLSLHGRFLLALDRLNGIDIYDLSSSGESPVERILREAPPTAVAPIRDGFAISDGGQSVVMFHLQDGRVDGVDSVICDFAVTQLAAAPSFLIAGGPDGLCRVIDFDNPAAAATIPVGYPIAQCGGQSVGSMARFFIRDESGQIAVVTVGDGSVGEVARFEPAEIPLAFAATDRGLLYADSGGRWRLLGNGETESKTVGLGGFFSRLAAAGDLIVAAQAGSEQVYLFEFNRGNDLIPAAVVEVAEPVSAVYVRELDVDKLELVVVHARGTISYALDRQSLAVEFLRSVSVDFAVSGSQMGESLLMLTSESGDGAIMALDDPAAAPVPVGLPERPRAIAIAKDRYVVIAAPSGVSVMEFDAATGGVTPIQLPLALKTAFDLAYDSVAQILLIADAVGGVRYLDFADPYFPGPVYTIDNSHGAYRLACGGDRLLALSSSRLSIYNRSEAHAPAPESLRADIELTPFHPNPFNSTTTAQMSTVTPVAADLTVVNLLGQTILRKTLPAMSGLTVTWDGVDQSGRAVASGIYFVRVAAAGQAVTRKVVLLK